MTSSRIQSVFFILLCVLTWSFAGVAAKLGQTSIDNHQYLFWSSCISAITLFIVWRLKKNRTSLAAYAPKQLAHIAFLSFLGTYLFYVLLYFGYQHGSGVETLIFQYTWPLWIVAFSVPLLQEKLTIKSLLALFLGIAWIVAIVTRWDIFALRIGNIATDLYVFIAAAAFGLFSVLSKKSSYDNLSFTFLLFAFAVVWSGVGMLVFSTFSLPNTETTIWLLLLNGVLINGLSYIFWFRALALERASFVAPFVFLTPVLATVWFVVFFHETMMPAYIFGFVSVILAGIVSSTSK